MPDFVLHPQLAKDSAHFRELSLCSVRIMDNQAVPWLVLVPRVAGAHELIDLAEAEQQQLMREIVLSSQALRAAFRPDKLNIAALGNVVPQLHVHVVARFRSDAAWPKPVWGNLPTASRSAEQFSAFCTLLERHWPSVS